MSLRKKKINAPDQLSKEEIDALSAMESRNLDMAMAKIPADRIDAFVKAEETMFKSTGDNRLVSGYKKISDMPTEKGIVIHNPVSGNNEGYLDPDGDFRLMSGALHPATVQWKKKVGS